MLLGWSPTEWLFAIANTFFWKSNKWGKQKICGETFLLTVLHGVYK